MPRTRNRRSVVAALESLRLDSAPLPMEEVLALSKAASLATLQPGTRLASIGAPGSVVSLVVSGSVAVRRSRQDPQLVEASLTNPVLIGELSAFGSRLFQIADVEVAAPASVLRIDASRLRALLSHTPMFATWLENQRLSREELLQTEYAEELHQRHAAYLCYLDALERVHA